MAIIRTRGRFARKLLREVECPVTDNNVIAMVGWMDGENTVARWNPLATTQPWPGSTNFNSVGVKNFASFDDGIAATAKTLTNGYYGKILSSLRADNKPIDTARAVADSVWGTGQNAVYGTRWAIDNPRRAKRFPLNKSRAK